jgi:tetratricopeptide (TPR) repeat protein
MILETIREFGLEAFAKRGELEAARQSHAAYYLRLVEEAEPGLLGPQQVIWFHRWEQEYNNLRAALNWFLERGEGKESIEMALRLGAALGYFWEAQSHLREGWSMISRALERSEGVAISVRAKALSTAGLLAGWLGNVDRGEELCQQSLALFRERGDVAEVGNALLTLASIRFFRGDYATSRIYYQESLEAFKEVGDKSGIAWSLYALSALDMIQGDTTKGYSQAEASLLLFREIGEKRGIAQTLAQLAWGYLSEGDVAKAHPLFEESCALYKGFVDKAYERLALCGLGWVAFQQGNIALARSLLEEASATFQGEETPNNLDNKAFALSHLARVEAFEGDYVKARALYEQCLAIVKQVDFKVFTPFHLEGLAAVVAVQGELPWAARLWGTAEALRDGMGTPIPPVFRVDYERSVATARTHLGEQAFAAAWAEGRTMTLEQVLAESK